MSSLLDSSRLTDLQADRTRGPPLESFSTAKSPIEESYYGVVVAFNAFDQLLDLLHLQDHEML